MRRILFFILVLGLLVSFGNQGWIKLYHLKHFEQSLQKENSRLEGENSTLQEEIERLKTADYLERFIRDEMGFVRGNEIVYEISDLDRQNQSR